MTATSQSGRSKAGQGASGAILRSAERIFSDKGLEGARTDEIARAARVNKALLYYYFKSKDDLFLAVVDEFMREAHEELMGILSSQGSERQILLRYAEALFDRLSQRPDCTLLFQRVLMAKPRLIDRLARKYFRPRFRKLTRVIRRGVRRGELRPVDAHHAASCLGALIVFYFSSGTIMKKLARADPFDPRVLKRRKREILEFIRYGLFKHPEAPAA